MPTRTYLTTPPGREPTAATGRTRPGDDERYVPGLAAPVEPRPPSRWRGPLLVLLSSGLLALLVVGALRLSAASQAQDPSLDPTLVPGGDAPADGPAPDSLPGEG